LRRLDIVVDGFDPRELANLRDVQLAFGFDCHC
jgi:hypothetical protein